ncbi:MAG: hypothetical protein JSS19_16600 [Proteobacteria bacterium]|nr:hypothetical protein [Pseudomonadota bacterium]MBS0610952.1 hypothetical protein [Pseudomonadota bacterium]
MASPEGRRGHGRPARRATRTQRACRAHVAIHEEAAGEAYMGQREPWVCGDGLRQAGAVSGNAG